MTIRHLSLFSLRICFSNLIGIWCVIHLRIPHVVVDSFPNSVGVRVRVRVGVGVGVRVVVRVRVRVRVMDFNLSISAHDLLLYQCLALLG